MLFLTGFTYAQIPSSEEQALIDIYNSTTGSNWTTNTGWNATLGVNTPVNTNDWFGITITGTTVTGINLQNNNLSGSLLASAFANLPNLEFITITFNPNLTGSIPSLAGLNSLKIIYFNSNQLTGSIPSLEGLGLLELVQVQNNKLTGSLPDFSSYTTSLGNLQSFNASNNQLTGVIPSLQSLTSLVTIYLQNNQLTGSLPNFGSYAPALVNLQNFVVSTNRLTGTIPSLESLVSLEQFQTSYNQLTGSLPDFGSYAPSLVNLKVFYASSNQLTGTIPSLQSLTSLEGFRVNINQLTGAIPSLEGLNSLQSFQVASNQLTGSLPDFGSYAPSLVNLQIFYAYSNQLNGTISSLESLTSLVDFQVQNNQLTGSFPDFGSYVAPLANLQYFYANFNQLTGSIGSLEGFISLKKFEVQNNQLTGSLPDFGSYPAPLANLEVFLANDNALNGAMGSLEDLTSLVDFQVQNNQLTGSFPDFGSYAAPLANLQNFSANSNQLTGSIGSLEGFISLENFEVQNNQLTGNLPDFGSYAAPLANLQTFYANSNQLTGAIGSLEGLTSLEVFQVQYNQLTGSLPDFGSYAAPLANLRVFNANNNLLNGTIGSLQGLTSLQSFQVQYNQLTGGLPDFGSYATPLANLQTFFAYNNQLTGTIGSLEGLSALRSFMVNNNLLTGTLPNFASYASPLVNLQNFSAYNNQLTGFIGSLESLTSLAVIQVQNNLLTGGLPNFGSYASPLVNLENFSAYNNQITGSIGSLQGLTSIKLYRVYNNQLTGSLPDFASYGTDLANLEIFYAYNNQITGSIGSLQGLTSLINFQVQNNQLTGSLPDFTSYASDLAKLELYYVNSNQFTGAIPSLEGLTSLKIFNAGDNQLTGSTPNFGGYANALDNLQVFAVNNNLLDGSVLSVAGLSSLTSFNVSNNLLKNCSVGVLFPDFSGSNLLTSIDLRNNKFSFQDFEPNFAALKALNVIISPQLKLDTPYTLSAILGSTVTFDVNTCNNAQNKYQWYKNNVLIPGATGSSYSIPSVADSHSGAYEARITNTTVTGLTLVRQTITLGTTTDNDFDLVGDDVDLDDDNDGILDTDEYVGGIMPFGDEDGDGTLNFEDVIDNGDVGDGSVTNYTDANIDGVPDAYDFDLDGSVNHLDIDSDADGCVDANEAYNDNNADSDGSGYYGTGSPAVVNSDGTVVGASYASPENADAIYGDTALDFLQLSVEVIAITAHPDDTIVTPVNTATFSVAYTTAASGSSEQIKWQEQVNGVGAWIDILDGDVYSGTTTATLSVKVINGLHNESFYRAIVFSPALVCNPDLVSNAAVLITTINNISANDDSGSTIEGAASIPVANVLENDDLADATPTLATVNLTLVSSSNAEVTLNTATGGVEVSANALPGNYIVVYEICEVENPSNCSTATVFVTVLDAGNPTAVDDLIEILEDTSSATLINAIGNDDIIDNATYSSYTYSSGHGAIIIDNGDGTFLYTPPPGFSGLDSFSYTICDNDVTPQCDQAVVTINVIDQGSPFAVDDNDSTSMDNSITTVNVLLNDTMVDNAILSTTDITSANGGTVVNNLDGTFNYSPPLNYFGIDTFNYIICDDDNPSASCSTATVKIAVSAGITDLVTTKVVDNATPVEGATIVYTIEVTNTGSTATGVSLVDNLPAGVTYVSDDSSGAYNSGSGIWTIGVIADGATSTLNITATVNSGTSGDVITNFTTAATGDQSDPTTVGDDLEALITVENYSDIVLTKVVDNATPNTGDLVTYTITITNNGPAVVTNLVLEDILPIGVEINGDPIPTSGLWVLPNWNVGVLATGTTETLVIKALVTADGEFVQPDIINTASHTQNQVDSSLPSDASATINVTSSDLVTIKSVNNPTPEEGELIIYSIEITNYGPSNATGVSLVDLLPEGVTYVSDNQSGSYNSGDGNWLIGDLEADDSITLEITARVDALTSGDTIINATTAAAGEQTDPNTQQFPVDILEAEIVVENYSDILIIKEVDNATPNTGDTVTYTVTVTNNGPAVVTNLVVEDILPSGLAEGLVTPSAGIWTSPNWELGTLLVGETETMTIEAVVTAFGTLAQIPITNTASHTQDQEDSSLPSFDTADIIVTASDLVTVKTVSDATPEEGDTIVYTIKVTNNGPSPATGVVLTDILPAGVTYISNDGDGDYNHGSGIWTVFASGNNVGVTATLLITATVDEGTAGTSITNYTTAANGDQTDPTTDGDDLDATITVENYSDIVLTKVVDNATPNVGDMVTYTVTVKNNGQAKVTGLVVTDVLPTGLTYGTVSPSDGIWTAPNWNVGNLESGEEETIVIEAVVGMDQGGKTLINIVSNSQDQVDSNLTEDDASETIVVTSSDLETLKTVSNAIPNEGDTITYTIQVTNNGPSNATNVSLVDKLPVGVTYVSHTSGAGTYNFGSGLWDIGNISNGATVLLTIVATVDDGTLGQTITNTTSAVIADQSDSDTTNNIGSVSIVPTAYIDLSLTKTVVDDVVAPEVGDTITFEIRVANEGPTEATGVQVTDLIPSGYDFVNYSSSIGSYNPITGLWNIGFIEIGNTAVLLVDVIVMDSGEYENCAEITAASEIDVDSTPGNSETREDDYDCASAPPIQELDLKIEKTVIADNLTPLVNTEVSFEIRVINDGNIEATEVVVTDLLPTGYTFLNYSSTRGTYDDDSGLWKIGRIVDGETEILVIDAIVNATGDYLNCATITEMHQVDPDLSNNTSCIATDPIDVADLELTKEVALSNGTLGPVSTTGVLQPYAETNVDFTITLTNNGPSDATGVQVLDQLPNGYNFVTATVSTGMYDENSGIWNVGTVTNGASETLIITAYVNPIGNWLNVAEVIAVNELDLDSAPNNGDIFEDDMDQIATDPIVPITIPEGFTPNGDGINDVFEIEFLEVLYPNFSLEIVDRYGNKVYKYKHNGNPYQTPDWWDGYSTGRFNLSNDMLPTGTYFYTIYFNNNDRKPQTGWIYLRK